MKVNRNGHRIATTLGELIAMISDVAFEYSDDTKEAYHLSRLVLVEILKGHLSEVKSLTGTFPRVNTCINLL